MTRPPLRVAVLASGRGSNFVALATAMQRGLPIDLVGVFSDRPRAAVLVRAAEFGIPAQSFAPTQFADRAAYEAALFGAIDQVQPDLIVCAGYMRLLGTATVQARLGRMINIHPSLLPRHRGLHTHQRALDAGDCEHGASVHFVTPELDGGPVIAQARVPIEAGDDPLPNRCRWWGWAGKIWCFWRGSPFWPTAPSTSTAMPCGSMAACCRPRCSSICTTNCNGSPHEPAACAQRVVRRAGSRGARPDRRCAQPATVRGAL